MEPPQPGLRSRSWDSRSGEGVKTIAGLAEEVYYGRQIGEQTGFETSAYQGLAEK
jgi:hypothetical protein